MIGGLFEPLGRLIDNLHTSDEERLEIKRQMFALQVEAFNKAEEYESNLLEAKKTIITAEAQSDSPLAKNWRPITMLSMVALVGAYWFGLTPDTIPESVINQLFTLVQIGIGGYVVGRSVEKTALNWKKDKD